MLVKRVTDRKVFHIEDVILSMSELNFIVLFDKPIEMQVLIDENEKHKQETGRFYLIYFPLDCRIFSIISKNKFFLFF